MRLRADKAVQQLPASTLTESLAVHFDSNLPIAPTLRLEPGATLSIANSNRRTDFGSLAGAAAVTALHLAQIETHARIALQQLASLATLTVRNQYHNNRLSSAFPHQVALLSLLHRQEVSAGGFNVDINKTYKTTRHCFPAAMYHQNSRQQAPQPFSSGPGPHHPPHPNQHQSHNSADMLTQVMGFQFPRPTQLPDELESALAIRGARDMDHRLIDHMNTPNQHQNQGSVSGISQRGNYGSPVLTSDNQPSHLQGVDWSTYHPPTKLFSSPPPSSNTQSHHHQVPQRESSHLRTNIQDWTAATNESTQSRQSQGVRSVGRGDSQSLYTPESAGSILASFGLSNEDLEVLSHYPDDQLTPDTLPFILRDIQINKSGKQKNVTSTNSSSFTSNVREMHRPPGLSPSTRSHSPEVPSLLTVTHTAGKVIDYGHASRAKEETATRETFKREPLSNERTVKMYPSAPKADKAERRVVNLEHDSSKHGDQDYRRGSADHRKNSRSPRRELPPSSKSRNLDQDYRREGPKLRPTSETRSEDSSRRSLSSSSGSKSLSSCKKLPAPSLISDFSGTAPKVYPHTCRLCHTECDEEKDWIDHINTVNHTAACRDLRNKYPYWKPNLPSRSGRYGHQSMWDPNSPSRSRSPSQSHSRSRTPSPRGKHRVGPERPHGKPYNPHHQPRYHPYQDRSHGLDSPSHSHRSPKLHHPGKRDPSELSSKSGVKHPGSNSVKGATSQRPYSTKTGPISGKTLKPGPSQPPGKSGTKTGMKTTSAKAASAKPPPPKKKKKVVPPTPQNPDCLVYLTGIPSDCSKQEVLDLVGSFGKIKDVILLLSADSENKTSGKLKMQASVRLEQAEDAVLLAASTDLSIRDHKVTASLAKKPEVQQAADTSTSKPASGQETAAKVQKSDLPLACSAGNGAEPTSSDEIAVVLISGLPESGCSESDIIKLFQPFGEPSEILLATPIGKALVLVPGMKLAEELVKALSLIPAKIQDSELTITHIRSRVGLNTPVALYNLLMGSVESQKKSVGWTNLLVIRNVPVTPTSFAEVQRVIKRFGNVIKTLMVNNMVICEMANSAMALSLFKRFQTYPCIIQNNPLFFSRKPDPKTILGGKVNSAPVNSPKTAPSKGATKSQTAAAAKEKPISPKSQCLLEVTRKRAVVILEKMETAEEKKVSKAETKEPASAIPNLASAPDTKLKPGPEVKETPAVQTVLETKENNVVAESETGNDKAPSDEATKLSSSDSKAVPAEVVMQPQLPKVTQDMVNILLVECRTRTTSQPQDTATSALGVTGEVPMETERGEKSGEAPKETKKTSTEEQKKLERERKEREARKEKETRERVRKERERREYERDRAKRYRDERSKREEDRKESERRERERKDRKRAYDEGVSRSRSSSRSDGHKHSFRRNDSSGDEQKKSSEEKEEEEFPFNLSDLVTLDEVGDVVDFCPSPSLIVPMETTEVPQDTTAETATETTVADATAVVSDSKEEVLKCEPVKVATTESTPTDILTTDGPPRDPSPHSQSPVTTCHPEPADTETTPAASSLAVPDGEHQSPSDPTTDTPLKDPTSDTPPKDLTSDTPPTDLTSDTPPRDPTLDTPPADPTKATPPTDLTTDTPPTDLTTDTPPTDLTTDTPPSDPVSDTPPTDPTADRLPADPTKATPPADATADTLPAEAEGESNASKDITVIDHSWGKEEMLDKPEGQKNKESGRPTAETAKQEASADDTLQQESVTQRSETNTDCSLPPFDPSSPVGLEYLVPKTGFFCKPCNRFFTGVKDAEISHCKTLKHYDNLQKYLQSMKTVNVTVKPNPS